ncbi:hypothetical protein Glove_48g141 [Diversispora epigaea]|uniref:Uncharacterized protein n=1 Tax=Diversispora epigaea TaxID=1348612 RepID=A0A397JF00_9GLOM|nr:hypothetical protein Glove_48g141 [Diversispora epigaea]
MNKNASLETRIIDLQDTRDRAQERIEMMTVEKINHETILMEKFKKVLNSKKKKIKKLMKALNTNGSIISSMMMISGEKEEVVSDELDELDGSNDNNDDNEISSKKVKLDNKKQSPIFQQSPTESLTTSKSYHGHIVKSRRMIRKVPTTITTVTTTDNGNNNNKNTTTTINKSTSLDDILVPVDNNSHERSCESQDYNDDNDIADNADNLLDQL